jgi:hypothetical protein
VQSRQAESSTEDRNSQQRDLALKDSQIEWLQLKQIDSFLKIIASSLDFLQFVLIHQSKIMSLIVSLMIFAPEITVFNGSNIFTKSSAQMSFEVRLRQFPLPFPSIVKEQSLPQLLHDESVQSISDSIKNLSFSAVCICSSNLLMIRPSKSSPTR